MCIKRKMTYYFPRRLARRVARANMERAGLHRIAKKIKGKDGSSISYFADKWTDWVYPTRRATK